MSFSEIIKVRIKHIVFKGIDPAYKYIHAVGVGTAPGKPLLPCVAQENLKRNVGHLAFFGFVIIGSERIKNIAPFRHFFNS